MIGRKEAWEYRADWEQAFVSTFPYNFLEGLVSIRRRQDSNLLRSMEWPWSEVLHALCFMCAEALALRSQHLEQNFLSSFCHQTPPSLNGE